MRTAILFLAALALPATAQIQVTPSSGDALVAGESVRITLDTPGDAVAVWRPNSAIPDTVALTVNGTEIDWTPSRAGVATIVSGEASTNVSVRYSSLPVSGLLILLFAGLILFGGAGFAMNKLLSGNEVPDLPMDT